MPQNQKVQVNTSDGILEGNFDNNQEKSFKYYSFLGIPYAKPPIGDLRFKPPKCVDPWIGVKDASKGGPQCYGQDMDPSRGCHGSEDCLHLNVFTRELAGQSSKPKAVMVFIHGGAFTKGSNNHNFYGPEFLLREDIVLVTLNYRLGLLGFLWLYDPNLEVPGNAGLKDQVLALKWVQKNIANFNGNPENVTIFGQSAGSASVHLLMLSNLSKGLFHKAILQSGVASNPWVFSRSVGQELAKLVNIDNYDEKKLLEKLRSLPVTELHTLQMKLTESWGIHIKRPIGATIENKSSTTQRFLTDDPIKIIKSGKYNHVPMMIGYTSSEGIFVDKKFTDNDEIKIDFKTEVPCDLNVDENSPLFSDMADRIRKFYFGDATPTIEHLDNFHKLKTDSLFVKDIHKALKLHVETSKCPIYFYRMSIDTDLNMIKRLSGSNTPGASHADDIFYLFSNNLGIIEIEPNSNEDIAIRRFCKLWANFAKFGQPTPDTRDEILGNIFWPPVLKNRLNFLDIDTNLSVGVNPDEKSVKFWEELCELKNVSSKL